MSRLTDVTISAIKPPDAGQAVYKDPGSPLQLRVSAGGAKTFFTVVGNGRRHTIGRWGEVTLAKAREVARRVRAEKTLGRYATHSMPLETAKEEYLARIMVRPNTRRSYAHYLDLLKTTDTREIMRLLDAMTPRVRNQALLTYKTFFKWCLRRDHIERSPVEKLQLANVSPRTRLLTDEEIRLIYRAIGHDDFSLILRLLLFTGQRRNEIASLRAEYIKDGMCTLPASVTKNKREHPFPLSAFTISLLPKRSGFLFPAPRNKSGYFNAWSHGKKTLDRRLGGTVAPWTVHDLRRYFASTMARLGVKQEVTERLLNHKSGIISGIAAIYTLHDFMPEMHAAVDLHQEFLQKMFDS